MKAKRIGLDWPETVPWFTVENAGTEDKFVKTMKRQTMVVRCLLHDVAYWIAAGNNERQWHCDEKQHAQFLNLAAELLGYTEDVYE